MGTINYRDGKMDPDDVHQEEVCGMANEIIELIKSKMEIMGVMDVDVETILENDCYDDVMGYFEKMFNYPEYRHHN